MITENSQAQQDLWPEEIRLNAEKTTLNVRFEGGEAFAFPAEFLRVLSPSAEVQGHSPSERKTVPLKRHVKIKGVEPVGNYAIRIIFDDFHDSGIYGWDLLLRYGREFESRWASYLAEMEAKGLTRG